MPLVPTIDFAAARAAIQELDAVAFARAIADLGVALEVGPLVAYARRFVDMEQVSSVGDGVVRALYGALHHGTGFGLERRDGLTCFVVRVGDRIVAGVQRASHNRPFPADGWPIGRWYGDPTRNIETAARWAEDPLRTDDALRLAIVRRSPETEPAQRAELLAAVVADPDDDAARLVYADWLLVHGDARGELIRVQCELARREDPELRAREATLLRDHRAAILAGISAYTETIAIARGLVDRVAIREPELVAHGAALLAQHPVRSLRVIVDGAESFARLATLPGLAPIQELAIEVRKRQLHRTPTPILPSRLAPTLFRRTRRLVMSCISDDDLEWERFFAFLDAPALVSLGLEGVRVGPETLPLIVRHAPVRELLLDHVIWVRQPAPEAAFAALAEREGLQRVGIRNWPVPPESVRTLVANPSLVELAIENVMITDVELHAIARSSLQRLAIRGYTYATIAGLAHLVRTAAHLRELEFTCWEVGDELVEALVAAPARLAVVEWRYCRLTPAQIERVRERRTLRT